MSSSSENKVIESLDFSLYQAKVTEILEGSDLQTITAKSIRKLIQGHFNHDLSLVKKKFDACAIEHFQKYCEFKELAKTFGAGGTSTAASPSVAPKTPVSQKIKADAEVKVKIESVSPPAVPVKKEKKAAKRVKSSSTVGKDDDSDMNNDDDHDTGLDGEFDYLPHRVTRGGGRASEAASSATSKKRKRNPSSCLVSDKLAAVIGCKEVFKNEITRKVWDYIKANDLQDPENKQYILCDELLQNLAAEGESISRLYMFHLSRVLTPHITIIKKDTPAKKTRTGSGEASSGSSKFNKLHYLSPALMELTGVEQESRPQVTQKLWAYIKGNNLQDPKNGQFILNDELMQRIFKKKRMSMFEMAKLVSENLFDYPPFVDVKEEDQDGDEEEVDQDGDGEDDDGEDDEHVDVKVEPHNEQEDEKHHESGTQEENPYKDMGDEAEKNAYESQLFQEGA